MANKPTKAEYEGFKKAVANPMTPPPIKQKLQSIIDEYSSEYEGSSEAPKAEPKSREGRKPSTTKKYKPLPTPKIVALITATRDAVEDMKAHLKKLGYNPEEVDALNGNQAFAILEDLKSKMGGKPKRTATPRATKKTATDIEKAKAEIKAKTGKTEAECESIIEQYRSLRSKAQEGKRKAEKANTDNKERVSKLERKGDIIEGTNEKTADAVIESTAKDVAEKIEKQVEAVEAKAETEAKAEVAKDKTITTPKAKKEAIQAKVEKKVAEKTKTIVKRVVIDTSALLTSIATSLGKFDKDSQKEFLIKLRSDIDKLLAKYAFGGMTDGAVQTMNVQQSNMSSSSVNPTMFANGGGVSSDQRRKGYIYGYEFDNPYDTETFRNYLDRENIDYYSRNGVYATKKSISNNELSNIGIKQKFSEFAEGGGVDKEIIKSKTFLVKKASSYEDTIVSLVSEINRYLKDINMPSITTKEEFDMDDMERIYVDNNVIIRVWDMKNKPNSQSVEFRVSVFTENSSEFANGGGVSSDQRRKGYIYGYEFYNPYDTETFRNYLDRENIDYYSRNGVYATKKSISNNELSNIGIKQKFSEFAEGGGVEVSKAESIKYAMYQTFESYLSNKTTDAQLVSKLQRILGSRRWFRYFKGDTGASDFGSVKRALSQSVNRDGEKESMQISIDTKGLQIYDYYGDEMFEDGGVVGQEIVFDYQGEEKTGVIKDVHNSGDYIVSTDDGRTLLAQRDRDVISLGKMREKAPMMDAPRKRFGFFKDGGNVSDIDYSDILAVLEDKLTEAVANDIPNHYENAYNAEGEEVEHQSRDGFIAYTDGGFEVRWFEYLSGFWGSGYSLPTSALDQEKERQIDYILEMAKEYFIDQYPEIAEELGEDNINYNSLYEAGYESEAEELSEAEMENMDGTIMCEVGAYYYKPNNDRGIEGEHTLRLFGLVNLESPYHRSGNLEDRYDIDITFNSIEELEEILEIRLKEITDWFNGSNYDESTKELRILRMAKGGKLWIDRKGKGGLKGVKPSRKNTFRNEAVKRNMTSGQLATKVLASPSRYKGINPRSAQLVKNMGVRKEGGSIGDILRNRRGE